MPELQEPKELARKASFRDVKRFVYHEILRAILTSVAECQRNGGFKCKRVRFILCFISCFLLSCIEQAGMDEAQLFWPQICIVVNDNPEGQLLAGIYDNRLAAFPCRVCW